MKYGSFVLELQNLDGYQLSAIFCTLFSILVSLTALMHPSSQSFGQQSWLQEPVDWFDCEMGIKENDGYVGDRSANAHVVECDNDCSCKW
jgi:hypothetical protein